MKDWEFLTNKLIKIAYQKMYLSVDSYFLSAILVNKKITTALLLIIGYSEPFLIDSKTIKTMEAAVDWIMCLLF